MIGQIRGIILEKQAPLLLIDVQGIAYEVDAPMSTFYQLPELGAEVTLLTHFVVREDAQLLYGFYTRDERTLFRTLLKVNGVGPKLALTILSSASPEELVRCVVHNDTANLVRLPGVGKKTAERLIIELRDKLKDWTQAEHAEMLVPATESRSRIMQDAIAALISLGYKQADSNRIVAKIDDGTLSSEELIRRALREMM